MTSRPIIALIIDTSTLWGRNIIRGARFFTQEHGLDWVFCIHPWGTYDRMRLPRKWSGDGIIARITYDRLLDDIRRADCPTVNVATAPIAAPAPRLVHCTVDEYAVGKLAAEHFLERGFQNFGYFNNSSTARTRCDDLLAKGFLEAVQKAGFEVAAFCQAAPSNAFDWDVDELAPWLCQQPKPLAVLTSNSVQARQMTEACRRATLSVPEQVAVLAGDYDDVMCDTATPPLSAVDLPARQVGFHAARLLNELIEGRSPETPYLLEPNGITARQSTDSVAVADPELAMALSYLRNHASEYINVSTVLRQVPIGRRSLEQQCHKLLGRSPAAEIRRLRLLRAAQLLTETKLSINQVARNSGFGSPDILLRNFRRAYGLTPTDYRRKTNKILD